MPRTPVDPKDIHIGIARLVFSGEEIANAPPLNLTQKAIEDSVAAINTEMEMRLVGPKPLIDWDALLLRSTLLPMPIEVRLVREEEGILKAFMYGHGLIENQHVIFVDLIDDGSVRRRGGYQAKRGQRARGNRGLRTQGVR